MPNDSLDALRREIDEIDTALHDLIMRRCEVVEHISAAKGSNPASSMRPGREAEILRRLAERHRGQFPRGSLVRIWREMIAALTAMQGPYSIAVYSDGSDRGYWDMARDHFGSHTDLTPHASRRDVLAEVFEGRATHGVLPFPSDHDDPPWWGRLYGQDAPRVVLRLPFGDPGNARGESPQALVIARLAPESTGDDRTLLVVETAAEVGRGAVDDMLVKAGMSARIIASHRNDLHLHLVEADGFLEADDAGIQLFAARDVIDGVMPIGAYPAPLAPAIPG